MRSTGESSVEIDKSAGRGWGVFSLLRWSKRDIILWCPVLVAPYSEMSSLTLGKYCFEYGRGKRALALGAASFLNHSYYPNEVYRMDTDGGMPILVVEAYRDIGYWEEIFVSYNGDPEDRSPFPGVPSFKEETAVRARRTRKGELLR